MGEYPLLKMKTSSKSLSVVLEKILEKEPTLKIFFKIFKKPFKKLTAYKKQDLKETLKLIADSIKFSKSFRTNIIEVIQFQNKRFKIKDLMQMKRNLFLFLHLK